MCFTSFVILSWWLLFRDERALEAYGSYYPDIADYLQLTRAYLLRLSLNVVPTILFSFTALIAFLAYFVSLKRCYTLRTSITLAIVFQLIVFFSYPILSTDIFSYIYSERVATKYGYNIWVTPPEYFSEDVFEPLADWKDQTSVYGAVHQLAYTPASYLAGDNVVVNVIFFKMVALLASLATIFIVSALFEGKNHQAEMVRMIFWNPLFVLEFAGSGHNDILMIFFLLFAILLWKRESWIAAGIVLALSVQVKMIAILFFCFSCAYLFRLQKWGALAKYISSFTLITIVAFSYMQVWPWTFLQRVMYNATVYWQSLPMLVERFGSDAEFPFTLMFLLILLILTALQHRNKWSPLFTTTLGLACYLFFFSSAYWNWYALWLLCLAVFVRQQWLRWMILLFTMSSLLAYPFLWLSHRYYFGYPFWSIGVYFLIFGIPAIGIVLLKRTSLIPRLIEPKQVCDTSLKRL